MLKRLAFVELAICVALLAGITGLVFAAAVMRFFGYPLTWSVDMAQLLFMWLCMLGANRAMREKSHLGMEVLVKYLAYKPRLWLELLCGAIIIVFLGFLVVEGIRLTLLNRERIFGDSTLSYAWVTAAVPVGCALLAGSIAYNMVEAWRRQREHYLVYTRSAAEQGNPEVLSSEMLLVSIVFVVLMAIGMPVAFATGIAGFLFFMTESGMPMSIGVQKIASMSQSFPLLAVPFFVLAGHLMNESGITARLLKVSMVAVGWMSGGLAQVAIVLSTLMGGVSGSAVADAAMEARILGPTMIAKGYGKGFSAAAIAVGSLITATIPPSIGLILYGYVGNVSIGRLFLAGIIPGILMMVVLMVTAYLIAKKRKYVVADTKKPTVKALATAAWDAKWALFFPVALVLAIRGGVFTPSEVGAFAVVYALVIGFFAHRELTFAKVWKAFGQASSDVGLIMLIILMSGMIGFATIYLQLPQQLAGWMLNGITDPNMIVLVILFFLLVAGLALDSTVMVLLLTPIFVPIVSQIGMDPVHFGILMMSIVTLGGMTWPSGSAMFAVCALMNVTIEEYSIESIPFIAAVVALIAVLVFLPQVVLWLPNLAFGG